MTKVATQMATEWQQWAKTGNICKSLQTPSGQSRIRRFPQQTLDHLPVVALAKPGEGAAFSSTILFDVAAAFPKPVGLVYL
jgi:hypothetical protein